MGAALGAILRSQSELNVAYDIGGVLLSALGGALVPLSRLPGWARAIAPGSPGYWAMSALRSGVSGEAAGTLRACGVLLAIGLVFGTLACWRIARGWSRSRLLLSGHLVRENGGVMRLEEAGTRTFTVRVADHDAPAQPSRYVQVLVLEVPQCLAMVDA
jgi:hypothetical protein